MRDSLKLPIRLRSILAVLLAMLSVHGASATTDFAKGVDLSILKVAEDHGVIYRMNGEPTDAISIFKTNGCNYVRLRLFVNPSGKDGKVNTLPYTLALARRVKRAGLSLYLDLHYSDDWADAGHESIPAAWKDLSHDQLLRQVHDYTIDTLHAFANQGCLPDMVSIGNEITNGMMWPAGGPMDGEQRWEPLLELLKSGISAVRETAPASRIKVMIHLDKGGRNGVSDWFFSHCQNANLDFDVIGLSYYPFWHGSLDDLRQNLSALANKYHKDIYVAETGYDVNGDQGTLPYPPTLSGQKRFLEKLMQIVAATPGGHGKGIFYWEPAWIDGNKWQGPDWSGIWEDRALFDNNGNARPAIAAFQFNPDSAAPGETKWEPAGDQIKTVWGEQLDPNKVWQEYPRPIMARKLWQNLNGLWDYAIQPQGQETPAAFSNKILVPFCVESSLSGVQKPLEADQELWYHREFVVPSTWIGRHVLLHFGASNWKTDVYVNDALVGSHTGGYTPFTFDITDQLKGEGAQKLVVKVLNPLDGSLQPMGKQSRSPSLIWYTAVSGIWQTVWLEPVNEKHIQSVTAAADIDQNTLTIKTSTDDAGGTVLAVLRDGTTEVVRGHAKVGEPLILKVPLPRLWDPQSPFLYGLDITLLDGETAVDRVESYAAMRKISTQKDADGHVRIRLNNKNIFVFGPLDQGWWPDGLYTPPSDEAMRFDIDKMKSWGFNAIRKHAKVESARWYSYCDLAGMLVWQDMPSNPAYPKWEPFKLNGGEEVQRSPESEANYRKEWQEIMDCLMPNPSIVIWTPFNESWGQFKTIEIADWTKEHDPGRLVDPASGGNHRACGDILDVHHYPDPRMPVHDPDRANVLGEFGGMLLTLPDHLWKSDPKNYWDRHDYKSEDQVTADYVKYVTALTHLIPDGLTGACYTQTTDVEVEVNGLMTYDRKHLKVDEAVIREITHRAANWFSDHP